MTKISLDKALLDPGSVFKTPQEIARCKDLTLPEKIKVLHRWEYDMRELEVAEEENMLGPDNDILDQIMKTLIKLQGKGLHEHSAPTKQGGE